MQPMPDMATILKLAQSPAGQKLLSILHTANPSDLQKAAASASAGNLEAAKEILANMLTAEEMQGLLRQLEKSI